MHSPVSSKGDWYSKSRDLEVFWDSNTSRENREDSSKSGQATWHCGNTKKVKQIVARYGRISTMHGSAYVCANRKTNRVLKVIYRIIFFICYVAVSVDIVFLLQDSLGKESSYIYSINKDVSLGFEEDPDYFPLYPKITICRKPFYKTNYNRSFLDMVEYSTLALGYPFVLLSPQEVSWIIQVAAYGDILFEEMNPKSSPFMERLRELKTRYQDMKKSVKNFDVRKFIIENSLGCDEFFVDCSAQAFSWSCCDLFKPILTNLGVCYSLKEDMKDITDLQRFMDVSLVIDLHSPPQLGRGTEEGFEIFVTDPRIELHYINDLVRLKALPNYVTSIRTKLVKTNRRALYTTYFGTLTPCPTLVNSHTGVEDEHYSLVTCEMQFFGQLVKKSCDCESILLTGHSNRTLCDPQQMYDCLLIAIADNYTRVFTSCKNPCVEYHFDSKTSYMGLGGNNFSRIEILHDAKQYTYHEYRHKTFSSLFSQIGGALGLFLGASIISVVEVYIFVIVWLWYRLKPTKIIEKYRANFSATNKMKKTF